MEKSGKQRVRVEVCSDCGELSRRTFLKQIGVTAAAVSLPAGGAAGGLLAAARPAESRKPAETYVKMLYESLTPEQRKVVLFPFDHPQRLKVSNNWDVVDPEVASIGKFYSSDQQELIRHIFRGVTSDDGYERFQKQMKDDGGGFQNYTCAIFGKPGDGVFEWLMTGRHLTIRADGNTIENAAFGGPIFYGHAVEFNEKPDHPGNVWWHQSRIANEIFQSFDGKQRQKALLKESPPDTLASVALRGRKAQIPGVRGEELSADQKALLEKALKSMLSMYRESDVEEAMECLKKNGGAETLSISFYSEGDIGDDGIWDRWRVEGPAFAWYFRGSPHVHTWVNIAHRAQPDLEAAKPLRL
jgi:hypothetical protein